jgi:hypothetical protein
MKNYYDQQLELIMAQLRLKSLLEKRYLYFQITQPGGMNYDTEKVSSSNSNNVFDTYLGKVEEIDKQIEIIEAEIRILEKHLKAMEDSLRKMKGSLEKIFVARYIDGLTINQICRKVNYSRPQVYRKLKIINKIIKDETK